MIKISVEIPSVFDTSDPKQLQDFCTAVKLYCEEMAKKAKSIQGEIRTTVPTTDDFDVEGEDVRYDDGATRRTYTLLNGSVRYHIET